MAENLYFGIDLGTTNSVISYAHILDDNKIKTQVCKINRRGKEGGLESKEILPSVVYYKTDAKTGKINSLVGDFAKAQYGKKHEYVMKSVKSHMGSYDKLPLHDLIEDKKPEEISAKILKHLILGIKERLSMKEDLENVIITIPASFDNEKCEATLKAAELAGLKVKDENGNYLTNVLLYEPKAVIYNIANMVSNNEIPKTVIDFDNQKNILVFDLGGGTLDVALYQVQNNEKLNFPIIDELAVGRYTRIGGDDFDNLIAERLTSEFLDYNSDSIDEIDKEEIFQLMETKAEYVKLELSDKVYDSKLTNNTVSDDEEIEISEMDMYKGMEFEAYLSKKEIESTLKPLMGDHLSLNDINNIDSIKDERSINNIIYPIIEVLAKAKEAGKSIKVDSVILNGGMTKFYLIKERLQKLFGVEPISVNDPDLSVAKGAAFYQYCLDKLKIVNKEISENNKIISSTGEQKGVCLTMGTSIVNDNINLGLADGRVSTLIKAGTALPTGDLEFKNFSLPINTNSLLFPIYVGRGKTKNLPNMEIGRRRISLGNRYPAGTKLTLIANIDENKIFRLSGYVGNNRNEKINVTIDTNTNSCYEEIETSNNTSTENKNTDPVKTTNEPKTPKEIISYKILLNSIGENINYIQEFQEKVNTNKLTFLIRERQKKAKIKLAELMSELNLYIKNSGIDKTFEDVILNKLIQTTNHSLLKGKFLDIGEMIYKDMSSEGQLNYKKILRKLVDTTLMINNKNKDNIIKAIKILGSLKDEDSINLFEKLLSNRIAYVYYNQIITALGQISPSNDVVCNKFLEKELDYKDLMPYIIAVGKTLNRTVSERTDNKVTEIVKRLIKIVKRRDLNSEKALIVLGQICDSRDYVQAKYENYEAVGSEIATFFGRGSEEVFQEKLDLTLNVIFGLNLTPDEELRWQHLTK